MCAKRIFKRSIKKQKFRYVNFLDDGGSKIFATVKDTYQRNENVLAVIKMSGYVYVN